MPFDPTVPDTLQAFQPHWTELRDAYDGVAAAVAALDPEGGVEIEIESTHEHIGHLGFAEFQFRFPRLAWSLTDVNPANGGVGSTQSFFGDDRDPSTWTHAATKIMPVGLKGYAAHGARGLNYLLLHETAHTTIFGVDATNECWAGHLRDEPGASYGMNSPYWQRNEKLANNIARSIARACNLPFLDRPNPGYILILEGDGLKTLRAGF